MWHKADDSNAWIGILSATVCFTGLTAASHAKVLSAIPATVPSSGKFVNYTSILEEIESKGVTPNNNAAIKLQACGFSSPFFNAASNCHRRQR